MRTGSCHGLRQPAAHYPTAIVPKAFPQYERCIAIPGTAASICGDYRASAGINLTHDRADREAERRLAMPLRVLWGAHGAVGRCFDVMALWRDVSARFSGRALDCGHYVAKEQADEVLAEMLDFFGAADAY